MLQSINTNSIHIPLKDKSVHCIITSPPYWGLRNYQVSGQLGLEPTPQAYVANIVAVMRECWRVLRDEGTLWLVLGDSYFSTPTGNRGTRSTLAGAGSPNYERTLDEYARTKSNRPKIPDGYKPKDLCGIPWRVAFALQDDGWYLRSDIIWSKCLSGGTRLYAKTQKGEMPATLKDLVRLDPSTVKLWDGCKWNQVTAWGEVPPEPDRKKKSAKHRSAIYRGKDSPIEGDIELEFRSGERIGCTRNHKWPTQRGDIEAKSIQIGDIVKWSGLPEPAHPVFPSLLPDEDSGWFIGMYLAEGSQSQGTLQLSGHIKETTRNDKLKQIAESLHGTCAVHQISENGITANLNGPILLGLVETYIVGTDAKTKHLHSRCWERSNVFLGALLQGYLEGDASRRDNGSWKLGFANNDQLVADLRTLCARLGASVRLRRKIATETTTGKQFKCWRGDLVMNANDRRSPDGEVVAIRQSRARKFWNVSLAEEPHVFSLASGICSRNSNPMPESVQDRPTRSHEYVFLLSKQERYYYDVDAIREPHTESSLTRYNYGGSGANGKPYSMQQSPRGNDSGRNRRTVWTVSTQPYPESHFATFPEKLVEPMILAGSSPKACPTCNAPWERVVERNLPNKTMHDGEWEEEAQTMGIIGTDNRNGRLRVGLDNKTPEEKSPGYSTQGWQPTCKCYGTPALPKYPPKPDDEAPQEEHDAWLLACQPIRAERKALLEEWAKLPTKHCLVLDPFSGSGTTLKVATKHGRDAIGLELNKDYIALSEKRYAQVQTTLFEC